MLRTKKTASSGMLWTGHLSPANRQGAQVLMEEALGQTWSRVHEYPHPSTVLSPASCRHLVQLSLIFSLSKLKANTRQRAVSLISDRVGIVTWILWQQVIWKKDTRVTRQKHKGLLKKRTSALILWKKKKIKCNNCCLQKHVFCFSWQHLSPKTFFLCNYTFIWKVHKAERFASSQSTASCCLLWAKAFLFFPHQFSQPVLMKAIETDQNRSRTAEPNQRHNLAAL